MILIFSNSTKFNIGGLEIFNEELEALFNNNQIKYFRIPSITKNKFIDYPYRIFLSVIYVLMNFGKTKFVLVQYGNFFDILALPFLKLSFKPIRVIAHIGDSWKHVNMRLTKKTTGHFLTNFSNKIYIITDEQRSIIDHKNIQKVHTIVNEAFLKLPLNVSPNEKYLLFMGRVCIEKGIDDLIISYGQLTKTMQLPKLKLIGPITKSYKKHILKLINRYNVQDQVSILKPVYNLEEKIKWIDNAILLVHPSYSDAFPLIVIETFCRGICILSTEISETKNFIEFKEFLFSPGEIEEMKKKIKDLLLNQNNYSDQIMHMRNKSIKYTEGHIVKEIME